MPEKRQKISLAFFPFMYIHTFYHILIEYKKSGDLKHRSFAIFGKNSISCT